MSLHLAANGLTLNPKMVIQIQLTSYGEKKGRICQEAFCVFILRGWFADLPTIFCAAAAAALRKLEQKHVSGIFTLFKCCSSIRYAGKSSSEKLSDTRKLMEKEQADALVLCALDEIACVCVSLAALLLLACQSLGGVGPVLSLPLFIYFPIADLFNLRGSDVECNPVALAFAIITCDTSTLYVDPLKVTPEVV